MLKKRIVPIQLLKHGRLVKGVGFERFRDVGDPVTSSAIYNANYVDELITLNINDPATGIRPLLDVMDEIARVAFMPLAVGGGIRSEGDAIELISRGADKIVLNSICYRDPDVINRIATRYGAQAVVCMIDVRCIDDEYVLFSSHGQQAETVSLATHITRCQDAGAGEIVVQSIDRDGAMAGYDLRLASRAMNLARVPVLVAGGSGNYDHLKALFLETDVSAAVCGSIFNFSDSNPLRAKAFLANYGLPFKQV